MEELKEQNSILKGLMASIGSLEKDQINSHFDQIAQTAAECRRSFLNQIDLAATSKLQELQQNLRALEDFQVRAQKLLKLSDHEICSKGCEVDWLGVPSWVAFEPLVNASIPCVLNTSDVIASISGSCSKVGVPIPAAVEIQPCLCGFRLVWECPDLQQKQAALKSYKVKVVVLETTKQGTSLLDEEDNKKHNVEGTAKFFEVPINSKPSKLVTDKCFERQTIAAAVMSFDVHGCFSDWCWSPAVKLDKFRAERVVPFQPSANFCGVLYDIGTAGGSRPYVNPSKSGDVVVKWSSVSDNSREALFVQHTLEEYGKLSYTNSEDGAWMMVDLGAGRSLIPTAYSLRHGLNGPQYALRNWELQGQGEAALIGTQECWVVLKAHVNDTSLTDANVPVSWVLDAEDSFRYFRIKATGPNSTADYAVHCAGIELFGNLFCYEDI